MDGPRSKDYHRGHAGSASRRGTGKLFMAIIERPCAQVLLRFEFCTNVRNVICRRFESNAHVGRTALNDNRSGIDEEKKQASNPVDTVRPHKHPARTVCTEQHFHEKLADQVQGRPLLKPCESLDVHSPQSFYKRSRLRR